MDILHQDANSVKFDSLNFNSFPKWKITYLREIWSGNNFSNFEFLREQLFRLYSMANTKYDSSDYHMSYKDVGTLFGITKQRVHQIIEKQKKIDSGLSPKTSGRQSLLTLDQKKMVLNWIGEQHKATTPPTLQELTEFVMEKFSIETSASWAGKWVESKDSGLFLVDASPLEKERIEVSPEKLKEYEKTLVKEMEKIEPSFLFNLDETGIDDVKYSKKTVVSTENVPTCYKVSWPAGHITLLPTICADGTVAKPMIIIARKSIDNDLLNYGYPNGPNGYIVSSPKGYITADLFENYFEDILIPHINLKRKEKNKPNQKALVLIDGASAHSSSKLDDLLTKNNIKLMFIPPHSSHITQPLDLLVFSLFKKQIVKITTRIELNLLSKRIVLALKAIHMATNFLDIISSFSLAGFVVNLEPGKEKLSFDLSKILKNDRAPDNEIKNEKNKRKKKRTKLKAGTPKAKKQKILNRKENEQVTIE